MLLSCSVVTLVSCGTPSTPQYNSYFQPQEKLLLKEEEAKTNHIQQVSNLVVLTGESLRRLGVFLKFLFFAISQLTDVGTKENPRIGDYWGESIVRGLRTRFLDLYWRWFKEMPKNLPDEFREIKFIPSEKPSLVSFLEPLTQQYQFIAQSLQKSETITPKKLGEIAQILEKTLKDMKAPFEEEEENNFMSMFKNYSLVLEEEWKGQKQPYSLFFQNVEANLSQENLQHFLNLYPEIREFWESVRNKKATNFSIQELSHIFQTYINETENDSRLIGALQNKSEETTFFLAILLISKAWKDFKDSLFELKMWLLAAKEPYQSFPQIKTSVEITKKIVESRVRGVEQQKDEFVKVQTQLLKWVEKLQNLRKISGETVKFLNENTEPFKQNVLPQSTITQESTLQNSMPNSQETSIQLLTSDLIKFFNAFNTYVDNENTFKDASREFLKGENMVRALSKKVNNLSDLLAYRITVRQTAMYWLMLANSTHIFTWVTKENLQNFKRTLGSMQREFIQSVPDSIKAKETVNKLILQTLKSFEEQEKEFLEFEKMQYYALPKKIKENALIALTKSNTDLLLTLTKAWEQEIRTQLELAWSL